ncbi:hypothetical protein Pcinc_032226 [Petrolisthes cinctipes]|uniref:Uncharacterized protein n=1 Tax=Petrolisthes cinctipes TaxID=88211 RepID=A0AAE1K3P2_PETCI|nr:hypothetical protein Pcinc_032226 [Petrolisthes cinctipes]
MYMNTRANLDYWSTDNCCMRWSLKTGTLTIGVLSMVWQGLLVTAGVMMIVKCPIVPLNDRLSDNNMTELDLFDTNLTIDTLTPYDPPFTLQDTQSPSTILDTYTPSTTTNTTNNNINDDTLDTYTPLTLDPSDITLDLHTHPTTSTTTQDTNTPTGNDNHAIKLDPLLVPPDISTATHNPHTPITTTDTKLDPLTPITPTTTTTTHDTSTTTHDPLTPITPTTTTTTHDPHPPTTTPDISSDTRPAYPSCDTNCTTVCDTSCDKNNANNSICNTTHCNTTCDTNCNTNNKCNNNNNISNCTPAGCSSTNCNITNCSTICDTSCNPIASTTCNTYCSTSCDTNCSATCNNTMEDANYLINFTCVWLPRPEVELLGIYNNDKLLLVAGIFITYSGIYFLLSFCAIVGVLRNSVPLLHGWVAFTGVHNLVILAFLLVPLPFTTLPHLLVTICHFILTLYAWAVVKSYRHNLKVALKKPLLPEGGSITDFTVDGVDVSEIPVQV